MTKLLAQSNAGVLDASLTSQGGIARTIELATRTVDVQTAIKCTELGEGHGIKCPIKMQPSIKPTRLLEGHAIEDKGRTRHGDIGHITKVHI
jgi:hypothetical protein